MPDSHPAVERTIDLELVDQFLDCAADPEVSRQILLALGTLPLREANEARPAQDAAASVAVERRLGQFEADNALQVVEVHPLPTETVEAVLLLELFVAAGDFQVCLLVEIWLLKL